MLRPKKIEHLEFDNSLPITNEYQSLVALAPIGLNLKKGGIVKTSSHTLRTGLAIK